MPTLHPRPLSALALGLIVVIAPTTGAAPPAMPAGQGSGTSTDHYAIPPQPLYSALDTLAEQAGLQLVYSAELVQALDSPGVTGDYTLEDALNRLLAGTGLGYRYTGPGTVTLQRPDPLEALVAKARKPMQYAGAAAPAPKKPKAPAKKDEQGPTVLPEMTVTASPEQDIGYSVFNATTATKTDTPIMETPVSIQVVPRAVLDDQKTTRLKDALENVSGVRALPSLGDGNRFIIRGFRSTRVYRNGLLSNFATLFSSEHDAGNLQSIEVLKGPAAILYGRIEPGGLVNITTKKPFDTPYYSLEQQFGSYDFYRTQWDATGALTEDKSLLYRFTGAYQNTDSFRDFGFTDRVLINPSITWRPTDSTDLRLDVERLDQDHKADFGLPAIGNRPAPIPISRSLDDPNIPKSNHSHIFVSTEIIIASMRIGPYITVF